MIMRRLNGFVLAACVLMGALSAEVEASGNLSIDIFAIPSKPIVRLVKQTSDQLKYDGMMSFYEKGRPVHITLYLTSFPKSSEAAIKQTVKKIAGSYRAFPVEAKGLTVTKGNWAFINLESSTSLQRLADKVTLAVEPLRDKNPTLPGWVKAYPNKLAAFKRYGSPNVFQNFEPHLTLLAAEKNPKLAVFKRLMQAKPPMAKGKVIGMGIGITDQWGQQKKVLAEYFFKK